MLVVGLNTAYTFIAYVVHNSMKYILVLVFTLSLFGQNYAKHIVLKGETITQIALKYKVSPSDIYNLNPDAQSGVQLNSVLLIPISKLKTPAVSTAHTTPTPQQLRLQQPS